MIIKVRLLLLLGILMSGCGVVKRGTIPWEIEKKKKKEETTVINEPKATPVVAVEKEADKEKFTKSEKALKKSLDEAFGDWKGVPYLLGGTGYEGVDCSSFMQIVFEDYFEIKLPRNTKEQIKVGKSVKKKSIAIGDLVFFKTGKNTLHVGVMVNSQEFMHASTSSGVMISGLQERYWSERYLTTRRVM